MLADLGHFWALWRIEKACKQAVFENFRDWLRFAKIFSKNFSENVI